MSIKRTDISPHPSFNFLYIGGTFAAVRDQQLDQLRREEADAADKHTALLACEATAMDRAERAAALRTEAARRKALRREHRTIPIEAAVTVNGATPFSGMTGTILSGDGRSYIVGFGGALNIEIEAWQLEIGRV